MFISEQEALNRLRSKDNLLNRLGIKNSDKIGSHTQVKYPEVEEKIEEQNLFITEPTDASRDDPERLAVLAERRAKGAGRGRYPNQGNVSPAFRSLIGATARTTSAATAAKTFGISSMQAYQYSKGRTAQNAEPDSELLSSIERDTQGIRHQVLSVLSFTIAGITPDKIENKDAKELSIIARNLGSIMSATKPAADFGDKTTNAQVIVFSPEQEQESFYPTKEIG